jgi:hypothetical protein
MHAPSSAEMLKLWESGLGCIWVERALAILTTTYPGKSRQMLASISIGERDAALLEVRESLFGVDMAGVIDCLRCRMQLELNFKVDEVKVLGIDRPLQLSFESAGYHLVLRLPNTQDILTVRAGDMAGSRLLLFERCLISASRHDRATPTDQLPSEVVDTAINYLGNNDAQADVELAISCPTCGYYWRESFDIVSFFWKEIEVWAKRLLREVHIIASAYGWREQDIVALNPARRQLYLEMIGT